MVEGSIRSNNHLLMVTLGGGANRHEAVADSGERYDGPDRAGFVSFLPAGCERRLRLHDVSWRWAAIAIQPELDLDEIEACLLTKVAPFVGVEDNFLFGMLSEFDRLDALDGGLDPVYCQTMTTALATYLAKRFAGISERSVGKTMKLPPWRLKRVTEYVDVHLASEIRIRTLAELCGLSERHFHRAFLDTTNLTPLDYIQTRRVNVAKQLLAKDALPVTQVAFRVGFLSPTHFARIFRAMTGKNPSEYRRAFNAN